MAIENKLIHMKTTDIEALLEKYDAGDTTLEEEDQLSKYFSQPTIPAHLEVYAAQFRIFAGKKEESASEQDSIEHFLSRVEASKTLPSEKHRSMFVQWGMRIAAGISLLLVGFMTGQWYHQEATSPGGDTQVLTAGVDQSRELVQMKKVLLAAHDEYTSASDRIQAVNQVYELVETDKEMVQLLINTMNFDPNINVRIAASEALFHFKHEPMVRIALVNSLKIQKDPAMQITLIDMLIQLKEKRAIDTMRRLLQNEDVLEVVKLKAEQGIGTLS
jgi:hypothetical protein